MNLDDIKVPLHSSKKNLTTITKHFFSQVTEQRQLSWSQARAEDIDTLSLSRAKSTLEKDDYPLKTINTSVDDKESDKIHSKKRRKLKQRQCSDDSQSDTSDNEVSVRDSQEESRARKLNVANLEVLELCFMKSLEVMSAVEHGLTGGDPELINNMAKFVTNGICRFTQTFGNLDTFSNVPMFNKLKLYQQCGVHWLTLIHSVEYASGILADEMGLGKTAQTGVFLSWLYLNTVDPCSSLIIVPMSILDSWISELALWAPNLKGKVIKYHGNQSERFKIATKVFEIVDRGGFVILISTIGTVSARDDVRILRNLSEFEYLVIDEAHVLKNADTIAYRRLSVAFNIKKKLLLTGTPVQNRADELGNLLQFAMPEIYDQVRIDNGIALLIKDPKLSLELCPNLISIVKRLQDNSPMDTTSSLQELLNTYNETPLDRTRSKILDDDTPGSNMPVHTKYDATEHNKADVSPKALNEVTSSSPAGSSPICLTPSDSNAYGGLVIDNSGTILGNISGIKEADLQPSAQDEVKETFISYISLQSMDDEGYSSAGSDSDVISPELRVLQNIVAPFILRRLKETVMHELPPKHSYIVPCKMSEMQRKLYKTEVELKLQKTNPREVSESEIRLICDGFGDQMLRRHSFVKSLIFILRRICNHPLLSQGCFYDDSKMTKIIDHFFNNVEGFRESTLDKVEREIRNWSDFETHRAIQSLCESGDSALKHLLLPRDLFLQSAKITKLFEIIQTVQDKGEKALIFSQFTIYLDLIEECLRLYKSSVKYMRLDGAVQADSRRSVVDAFNNDPEILLFLISTKAGGTGLNLTSAKTVVLMDQDWNPHNDTQAEDRAHRIGQTGPVDVYRLCCKDSVEEYIIRCSRRKLQLDDAFGGTKNTTTLLLKDESNQT